MAEPLAAVRSDCAAPTRAPALAARPLIPKKPLGDFGGELGRRFQTAIVVYTVRGDALYVVRILHGAQQWP